MGDRRMAEIKMSEGSLYIYTHSYGAVLPELAAAAIVAAAPRWSDEPYAARIIVDQITKSGRDQELGWGLLLTPNAEDEYGGDSPLLIGEAIDEQAKGTASVVIDIPAREMTVWGRFSVGRFRFDELTQLSQASHA